MSHRPQRGEIWWVEWPVGRGSEQHGRRPSLIVQTNRANEAPSYPNTVVVAISSKGIEAPFHIRLDPSRESGLTVSSYAKCEHLWTISKQRLERHLGRVSDDEMRRVDVALRRVLDL